MSSNLWELKIHTDWEDIWSSEFQTLWQRMMLSNDAHIFYHPVIVKAWVDTYLPLRAIKPLFVHAQCGEQEVLFPLVLWHQNWKNGFLRTIVPAGHSDFDYHDPLFLHTPSKNKVEEFYEALLNHLNTHHVFDRIHLDGMHELYLPTFGKVVNQEECVSWQLDPGQDESELVLPPKRKLARDIKRRLRRLEENGTLTFHRFSPDDGKLFSQSVEQMLACHALRWPGAYQAPHFYNNLIVAGLKARILDFVTVALDDKPIAWRICFSLKKRVSDYLTAFDYEYQNYSVGFAAVGYALQGALIKGMETIDHLRGDEKYKSVWQGKTTTIYYVIYDKNNLTSLIRKMFYRCLSAVKGFKSLKRFR